MLVKCPKCNNEMNVRIKHRSLGENKYLHGVLLPLISEHTGYTADEIKTFLKLKFGWIKTIRVGDEVKEVPLSTASMSTVDFETFMTQIRQWGDTQGMNLPEPNQTTGIDNSI